MSQVIKAIRRPGRAHGLDFFFGWVAAGWVGLWWWLR